MALVDTPTNKNVDQLNSFLRGEISAVETYKIALDKLGWDSPSRAQLNSCCESHQRRVDALRQKILAMGGEPAEGSGAWGALAKAIEGGAAVLGDQVAVAALEEGEDHGLKDYRADLDKLGPMERDLVTQQLLPLQEETHRTLSRLKHQRVSATR